MSLFGFWILFLSLSPKNILCIFSEKKIKKASEKQTKKDQIKRMRAQIFR